MVQIKNDLKLRPGKVNVKAVREMKFDSFKNFKLFSWATQEAFVNRIAEMSKTEAVKLNPVEIGKPTGEIPVEPIYIVIGGVIIIIFLSPKRKPYPGIGPVVDICDIANNLQNITKVKVSDNSVLLNLTDKLGNEAIIHVFDSKVNIDR